MPPKPLSLFAAPPGEAAAAPWTVSQTNTRARQVLEGELGQVAVAGEVAHVRLDGNGHTWFSLKDDRAALSAVLFRRAGPAPPAPLAAGQAVVVRGRLTVYAVTGRYQLVAQSVVQEGVGTLMAAYEALKRRLQAEGLFAVERKRPLPRLPRRVAVVTSLEGAVLRDIVQVAWRRLGRADIVVVPTRVQGPECAAQVAAALALAAAPMNGGACQVVILARGGGALTDLWGFNDERVARAIAASPLPVVSAVGHETDFTIADLAADLRAATPSVAAELVFPLEADLRRALFLPWSRQVQAGRRRLDGARLRLRAAAAALGDGRRPLYVQGQRISELQHRAERALGRRLGHARAAAAARAERLLALHPRARLVGLRVRLARAAQAGHAGHAQRLLDARHVLLRLHQRLVDLSPHHTLARGYAIVLTPAGRALRRAGDTAAGERLTMRLAEGTVAAIVEDPDL